MSNFKDLLHKSYRRRESLFEVTDAYRVVSGEVDGFDGLTIDRYGDMFQLQFFSPELLPCRRLLVDAVCDVFSPRSVVVKERLSASGRTLENPPMEIAVGTRDDVVGIVHEGRAKFHVDLMDTVNPGLFLDMRHVRLEVEKRFEEFSYSRFLNLFSYTCSFSVHARLGGADVATNADISGKILDKGRANYELNGLDLRPGEFFRGNAIEYVRWAQKKGLRFDGIVLDPPSFARFKGFNFNVREHLFPLVSECASILNPGGFLMVSSNYSEFNLGAFSRNVLDAVAAVHSHAKCAWKKSQDVDFAGCGNSKDSCLVATLIEVGEG